MKYLPELPTDAKRDELIEAVMKERNYPCNPNAAARCGWEAAMDHIAAAPEVSAEPVGFIKSLAEIDEARAKGQSMVVWPKPYSDTKVALYTAPPDLQKEVDRLKGEVERLKKERDEGWDAFKKIRKAFCDEKYGDRLKGVIVLTKGDSAAS